MKGGELRVKDEGWRVETEGSRMKGGELRVKDEGWRVKSEG